MEVLHGGGVQTESIEVYRTLPHPELEKMIKMDVESELPNWVIYFSPSGVDATLPLLRQYCPQFDSIRVSYSCFFYSKRKSLIDHRGLVIIFIDLLYFKKRKKNHPNQRNGVYQIKFNDCNFEYIVSHLIILVSYMYNESSKKNGTSLKPIKYISHVRWAHIY